MARIRSVHPGLFTDEAFMAASMVARVLLIGIWTECDDNGVFAWKPLTLKARLMPCDAVDVPALLDELAGLGFVLRFEHDGHCYGAVHNFCRFQRPKKPRSVHPIPNNEIKCFLGMPHDEFPTSGEKSPQMEDGGGSRSRKGKGKSDESPIDSPLPPENQTPGATTRARVRARRGPLRGPPAPAASQFFAFEGSIIRLSQREFDRWKAAYSGIPDLVAELTTIDAKLVDEGFSGAWFGRVSAWLQAKHAGLQAKANGGSGAAPYLPESRAHWRDRLRTGFANWPSAWGPAPGDPRCRAPPDVLAEFGWNGNREMPHDRRTA